MKLFSSLGLTEIIFVLIIGIIVLGPEETVKLGGKLGKLMRNVVTSNWWRSFQDTLSELKYLPYKLMREAQLEELGEELKDLERQAKNHTSPDLKIPADLPKSKQDKGEQLQNELASSAWSGNLQPHSPPPPPQENTTPNNED